MINGTEIAWIAADWGTTHLRLNAMGPADQVLGARSSDAGMARLAKDGFEPALIALAGDWFAGSHWPPVFACGMVGSRQGWVEAPYRTVPAVPLGRSGIVSAPVRDPRLRVRIAGGLRQEAPADVMRGEETQIAGFMALEPAFDGVLCLPGTHSKWVRIGQGRIESFQTFMTGELFALLSEASVLRHSVASRGWDEARFAEGLARARSAPERIGAELFGLRAEALLHGLDGIAARSRLSGLLIGNELAAARDFWAGAAAVAVIGAQGLGRAYARALEVAGVDVRPVTAQDASLAGLRAMRALSLKEAT